MSTIPNSDTDRKVVRAYDEAIAHAQVDPNEPDNDRTRLEAGPALTTFDQKNTPAQELEHALGRGIPESDFGPGDEMRDREFPVPAATAGDGSRKTVTNPHVASSVGTSLSGQEGTRMGDKQPGTMIPSIIDPHDVAPDLIQEQR